MAFYHIFYLNQCILTTNMIKFIVGDVMIVLLKKLNCDNDIEIFGKYKVELIKFHQQYAQKLGLFDNVVDNYNYDDAIRHIDEKGYFQFLIQVENEIVGIIEYQITNSDIDKKKILYIKDFYIDDNFRGKGIGKEVMKLLKELNYRIELECWYEMPANNLYKSLGMREIKTRYMMDYHNTR